MSASAAAVLAASDTGKGSPIGLFVVLLLVIATYLLYRSMTGHIRRLPERFPGYGAPGTDEAARPAGTGTGAVAEGASRRAGAEGTSTDAAAHDPLGSDGEPVQLTKRPQPPADR